MLDIFRNSIWTFIGTVVASIALAAFIIIHFVQRQSKRLVVESVVRVPLLANHFSVIEGLGITFGGQPLSNAIVVVVRVTNSGNTPILVSDYESPLSLEFTDGSTVLSADVMSSQPDGIKMNMSFSGCVTMLSPQLLNPADTVTCRILLKDSDGKFKASGRVVGVNTIEQRLQPSVRPFVLRLASIPLVSGAYLFSPSPKSSSFSDIRAEELPYMAVALLGFALMIVGTRADIRNRFRKRINEV